jgi:hypothetical protein
LTAASYHPTGRSLWGTRSLWKRSQPSLARLSQLDEKIGDSTENR